MDLALAIDFGSTFTKGSLFDLVRRQVLGIAYQPSTVGTDVSIGLRAVLTQLEHRSGHPLRDVPAFVCSSAAGGLRMAVIGLVPSLSLEAAQRAALGAGAKIIGAYGHKLPMRALSALESSRPDLLLLAGGIDGGDEDTILHNARALARSKVECPIVVAGNQFVADDCMAILAEAGHQATLAANILPDIDRVEVDEVRHIIRELFVKHITRAKGVERVAQEVKLAAPIVPTPAAVLRACQLLAEGCSSEKGLGEVVVVDIGGATTDVHSASAGAPTRPGVIRRGLPDQFLKRTVEGDLGMRVNAPTIVGHAGSDQVALQARQLCPDAIDAAQAQAYAERVAGDPNHVPLDDREAALDAAMARCAIKEAMQRHAGFIKEVYTGSGMALVQYGKDLGDVSTIVGVGGVLAYGRHALFALEGSLAEGNPESLLPARPEILVDRSYLLYAIGLLADGAPDAAFAIARQLLVKPGESSEAVAPAGARAARG